MTDQNLNDDIETKESTDDNWQSQNKIGDNQVSESLGPTTATLKTEIQQGASWPCPYTLRKKIHTL